MRLPQSSGWEDRQTTTQRLRKQYMDHVRQGTLCSLLPLPALCLLRGLMHGVVNCGVVMLGKLPLLRCCETLDVEQ